MVKALLSNHLIWNIPIFLILSTILFTYFLLLIKHKIETRFIQPLLFILGISLLYLVIGSPLLTISYLSFSLHMIQMSILFFIIPPLILLGIPHHMYQPFNRLRINKLFSPKFALIAFAVLFLIYHLPFLLTIISNEALLQKTYLSLLFVLAFRMWWPIASTDPKQQLSKQKKKKYAFQSGLFIMPACLLFIASALLEGMNNPFLNQLTTHICLPPNSSSIQFLPYPFNTKYDQIMAGLFMIGLHKVGLMVTFKLGKNL